MRTTKKFIVQRTLLIGSIVYILFFLAANFQYYNVLKSFLDSQFTTYHLDLYNMFMDILANHKIAVDVQGKTVTVDLPISYYKFILVPNILLALLFVTFYTLLYKIIKRYIQKLEILQSFLSDYFNKGKIASKKLHSIQLEKDEIAHMSRLIYQMAQRDQEKRKAEKALFGIFSHLKHDIVVLTDEHFNILETSTYWKTVEKSDKNNFLDYLNQEERKHLLNRNGEKLVRFTSRLASEDRRFALQLFLQNDLCTILIKDITKQTMLQKSLQEKASKDQLTNTFNKPACFQIIEQKIDLAQTGNDSFTILFLDLNGFKSINDNFGHTVGDKILQAFAKRLEESTRQEDIVYRYGGDEFLIVANGTSPDRIKELIKNIKKKIEKPIVINDEIFQIRSAVGYASYPQDGDNLQELLECADFSMYEDKRRMKGQRD